MTLALTVLAMAAFAANSILCRMALGGDMIDAASFTFIRLVSGAMMLALILLVRHRGPLPGRFRPFAALMLFVYAICFSFAYIELATGTGALLLFGAVQLTMIFAGVLRGERLGPQSWLGSGAAFAGLVYLMLPSVNAPPPGSALLMVAAGIAWGGYTLHGRGTRQPLAATARNFIAAVPLAWLAYLLLHNEDRLSMEGIALAVLSGALASGLGYALWYSALPYLSRTYAATVQLSVPVIAAFGGTIFMAEALTPRLLTASLIVLGGIYLTINATAKG